MELDFNAFIQGPIDFIFGKFLPALMNLEPDAVAIFMIGLVILFFVFALMLKFVEWLFSLVKRFILFFIVLTFLILFFIRFQDDLLAYPPNYVLIAVGAVGVIFALIALLISILSIKKQWHKTRQLEAEFEEVEEKMEEAVQRKLKEELGKKMKVAATPAISPTQAQQPQMLTKQALLQSFHDRSLLAVLSYIVVAEFGVFSSVTVAAPSVNAGIGLFAAFMIAAFIFIKTSYHSYAVGIRHLVIGTLFGIGLSILLGNVWVGIAIETLLSLEYFTTNSLVAFITGLAVSLFMGSKG